VKKTYNTIAGRSLDRLNALSDGLFAFAMTVIVLDIRIPEHAPIHTESELWAAIVTLGPQLTTYLMSFLTLGIFWVGQQTQLDRFREADRNLTWIHLLFLAAIAVLPLTTRLLAAFITFRVALLIYWANILILGALLYAAFSYAERAGLLEPDETVDFHAAFRRRIFIAQALYAFGALLCVINTYWSIGFIFLVQLNYAVAPRNRLTRWIG
jgi:uncharacterized membrane protein